jgi:hypothetical protein
MEEGSWKNQDERIKIKESRRKIIEYRNNIKD